MDLDYTPEQIQLRREVREFAAAEIAPHVMEWDQNQTFPLAVINKLGQLGYLGSIFPEEYVKFFFSDTLVVKAAVLLLACCQQPSAVVTKAAQCACVSIAWCFTRSVAREMLW